MQLLLLESCSRKAKKQSLGIEAPSCYRGVANPVEANQKKQRIRTTKQTNGMNGNLLEIHRKQWSNVELKLLLLSSSRVVLAEYNLLRY
jgi:hypothetical protein